MNSLGNTKAMVSHFVYPPPSDGKPFRLNMGLRSLEPATWLEGGEDLLTQIPERIELAAHARDVVYQELPGYQGAISELVERVIENLLAFHIAHYTLAGRTLTHIPTGAHIDIDADANTYAYMHIHAPTLLHTRGGIK